MGREMSRPPKGRRAEGAAAPQWGGVQPRRERSERPPNGLLQPPAKPVACKQLLGSLWSCPFDRLAQTISKDEIGPSYHSKAYDRENVDRSLAARVFDKVSNQQ